MKDIENGKYNFPLVIVKYPDDGLNNGVDIFGMKLSGSFYYNSWTESVELHGLIFGDNSANTPLIEGRTYKVAELLKNMSSTSRKFFTEVYVRYIYKAQNCPY